MNVNDILQWIYISVLFVTVTCTRNNEDLEDVARKKLSYKTMDGRKHYMDPKLVSFLSTRCPTMRLDNIENLHTCAIYTNSYQEIEFFQETFEAANFNPQTGEVGKWAKSLKLTPYHIGIVPKTMRPSEYTLKYPKDVFGRSPLYYASTVDHLNQLIKFGFPVLGRDILYRTPMDALARNKLYDLVVSLASITGEKSIPRWAAQEHALLVRAEKRERAKRVIEEAIQAPVRPSSRRRIATFEDYPEIQSTALQLGHYLDASREEEHVEEITLDEDELSIISIVDVRKSPRTPDLILDEYSDAESEFELDARNYGMRTDSDVAHHIYASDQKLLVIPAESQLFDALDLSGGVSANSRAYNTPQDDIANKNHLDSTVYYAEPLSISVFYLQKYFLICKQTARLGNHNFEIHASPTIAAYMTVPQYYRREQAAFEAE